MLVLDCVCWSFDSWVSEIISNQSTYEWMDNCSVYFSNIFRAIRHCGNIVAQIQVRIYCIWKMWQLKSTLLPNCGKFGNIVVASSMLWCQQQAVALCIRLWNVSFFCVHCTTELVCWMEQKCWKWKTSV